MPLGTCVSKLRDEARVSKGLHGAKVSQVDNHGRFGFSLAQVGDDAVFTGVGVFHDACVAVDGDRIGSHNPDATDGL